MKEALLSQRQGGAAREENDLRMTLSCLGAISSEILTVSGIAVTAVGFGMFFFKKRR